MLELTEKRTLHSKTHDLGGGKFRLTASMIPMHYEENGQLLDIDMTIQNGVVNSGLYKVELMTDKIGFHAIDRGTNKRISVNLSKIGNQNVPYAVPTMEGNKAKWSSVKPGVDIEFIFNPHQVNIFRVLQNASAEKYAEWNVNEEIGDKTIKMNDKVRGRDNAKNETKHTVVIAPPSTANNRKSYVIRDTFESKVFKRDSKTRVKTESTDVQYPVRIDPTVTIDISDTTDDGYGFKSFRTAPPNTINSSRFVDTYSGIYISHRINSPGSNGAELELKGFFRFPGITIPQSSTINSASLKPYVAFKNNNMVGRVEARKVNNPNAPTNATGIFNPATLATNVANKTFTTASGNRSDINVAAIVQELVNAFDYSNEAMLFFIRKPSTTNGTFFVTFEDLSAGNGNPAQLVIDYTAGGGSSIKTFNGITNANSKTLNGVTNANVKSKNSVSNV